VYFYPETNYDSMGMAWLRLTVLCLISVWGSNRWVEGSKTVQKQ